MSEKWDDDRAGGGRWQREGMMTEHREDGIERQAMTEKGGDDRAGGR